MEKILEITDDIYKNIALGKLPHRSVLVTLIAEDPERYTQALAAKALLDISTIEDEMSFAESKEDLEILKIKVKHLTFMAERLLPTVFGTKIEITTTEKQKADESEMQKLIEEAQYRTLEG